MVQCVIIMNGAAHSKVLTMGLGLSSPRSRPLDQDLSARSSCGRWKERGNVKQKVFGQVKAASGSAPLNQLSLGDWSSIQRGTLGYGQEVLELVVFIPVSHCLRAGPRRC